MDNEEAIKSSFHELLHADPDLSAAVAAITVLVKLIEQSKAGTLSELVDMIKSTTQVLLDTDESYAAISAGCDQFLRYITLANLQDTDFQKIILQRAKMFYHNIVTSRQRTVKLAQRFVDDGTTILTHSRSRVVMHVLKAAAAEKKRFTVYVTESHPDRSGYKVEEELSKIGIPTTVILDSAVGYIMEKVQVVMLGAEGVVESGGIINKIGSYPIAITAKQMNRPVFVVAESFKFVRAFPLNQKDISDKFKYRWSTRTQSADLSREHPLVDYTPPQFLDLMFTDLGVLTPSAVSDELIKLYC